MAMKQKKIKNFGFVLKPQSREAKGVYKNLETLVKKLGCNTQIISPLEELPKGIEMVIVLGGDGSLLAIARKVAPLGIPVLGVHLGQLGFIMETTVEEVGERIREIIAGKYILQSRVMLTAELKRGKKSIGRDVVLNDVVVSKGVLARIFELNVTIDGEMAECLRGDGVVIATPTGSTAYSLSAGGPVIHPQTDSVVVTPICSHKLTQRPLVVPNSFMINLKLLNKPEDVFLTLDGQIGWEMKGGDEVIIKKSKFPLYLVKSPLRTYYDILKDKLKLGH